MSLIAEPWSFANEVDNATGTPTQEWGTTVTPGTSNADGTAATLLTALAFDVHYIAVGFSGYNVSGAAAYCLADVLIDPAGGTAWRSFINDLLCGYAAGKNQNLSAWYYFPVFIKSGTSIGSRVRTSHTVAPTSPRVVIYAMGNPSRPGQWWCGSVVETPGVTAASSTGTSVTPGNTGVLGTWTNIGAVTNGRYGSIQIGWNGTDSLALGQTYHFQVGYNKQQLPGSPQIHLSVTTSETCAAEPNAGPIWCDIPQGTQMQIRGTCSSTAEVWAGGLALYGVY